MAVRTRAGMGAMAVVVAVSTMVAGCGGSASPEPSPSGPRATASPATTGTPAPGPTAWPMPERPASVERDDVVGAKAAAQYFIELYPYVYATGDLDEWRAMSHEDCEFCSDVSEGVDAIHRAGGYGLGGDITIDEVMVIDSPSEVEGVTVAMRIVESPSAVYSEAGVVQSRTVGGNAYYVPTLARLDDRWLVTDLSIDIEVE